MILLIIPKLAFSPSKIVFNLLYLGLLQASLAVVEINFHKKATLATAHFCQVLQILCTQNCKIMVLDPSQLLDLDLKALKDANLV